MFFSLTLLMCISIPRKPPTARVNLSHLARGQATPPRHPLSTGATESTQEAHQPPEPGVLTTSPERSSACRRISGIRSNEALVTEGEMMANPLILKMKCRTALAR